MTSKKETLFALVDESQKTAAAIEKSATQTVRRVRFIRDIGDCTKSFVDVLPGDEGLSTEQWDHLIGSWEDVHEKGQILEGSFQPAADAFYAVASGTTVSTVSVIQSGITAGGIFGQINERLYQLLNKEELATEVKDNMIRLQLETGSGEIQNPLDLFENAKAALDKPTSAEDAPVPVTIQLRECVLLVIDQLLKRRPIQELAQGHKISSIGAQCGRDGLSSDHFSRLQIDGNLLLNELSGTKDKVIPRQQLIEKFQRTAQFIEAFLSSIDEKKLRS